MNREYKNQKGKETIINEIRERLRWYTFEASEEDIDPKEMAAMVKLLEVLEGENREPEESIKEAYARFQAHRDQWEADEAEISALREQETLQKAEEKGRRKFVPGLGRKMGAKRRLVVGLSAAALFVAVFTAGGAVGVNAERNGGFFHWLKRDETGVTMITSPDSLDTGTNMEEVETYEGWNEVPEPYRQYEIQGEDLAVLQDYILDRIEIAKMDNYVDISSLFKQEQNENVLKIGVVDYENEIFYNRQSYLDAEYLYSIEEGDMMLDVLSQEDQGEKIYTVNFYFNKEQYYVQGKGELAFIEEAAREYYAFVSGK